MLYMPKNTRRGMFLPLERLTGYDLWGVTIGGIFLSNSSGLETRQLL